MARFQVVECLSVIALLIFQIQIFFYMCPQLLEQRRKNRLFCCFTLANTLLLTGAVWAKPPLVAVYFLALLLFVGEFIYLLRGLLDGLLVGGVFVFTLIGLHGVMIPLLAMLREINMFFLMQEPMEYALTFFWSLVASDLLMAVFQKIQAMSRLKILLRCRSQARLVCTSMCLLLAYLMLETYVYYYNFVLMWTALFHMVTSLVAQASFYVVLWYSIDISSYIEYELKTRQVEKQLQRQVVHYQQYTKYINSLRAFKHDYKRMAETAKNLVNTGAQQKALRLLTQMNEEMESSLQYIQYSNHVVVDAILQECATRCQEKGISFSAVVNLPEGLGLNDLELCRIFGNLVDNAYEACEQVEDELRFIRIESGLNGGWSTVKISNSFSGEIRLEDGLPVTRKNDQGEHGIGITSTKEIVESTGGFLQIEIDRENRVFIVKLHLCKSP